MGEITPGKDGTPVLAYFSGQWKPQISAADFDAKTGELGFAVPSGAVDEPLEILIPVEEYLGPPDELNRLICAARADNRHESQCDVPDLCPPLPEPMQDDLIDWKQIIGAHEACRSARLNVRKLPQSGHSGELG